VNKRIQAAGERLQREADERHAADVDRRLRSAEADARGSDDMGFDDDGARGAVTARRGMNRT